MKEEVFSRAANVIFYGTLDESFALKKAKDILHESEGYPQLKKLHQVITKKENQGALVHIQKMNSHSVHFSLPEGSRLEYWREFKFNAPNEVFYPLLYKWIGGYSDRDISKVLSLSLGSLTMRYNSGLRKLGTYLVKGGSL